MKQWYEELYENYGNTYDKESFTQGTEGEVAFIQKEIGCDKSKRILDVGCGTGRHSIELAKLGYKITGIDLSPAQIKRAKEKADEAGVDVDFHIMDARQLSYSSQFDLVIMLCEGGFTLMENDEMNYQILQNAGRALKNGGKLIFTTLNALFPLYHDVKNFIESHANESHMVDEVFNLITFRESSSLEFTDDAGIKKTIQCSERFYTPSEITWYLKTLGFKKIDIFGSRLGAYSRNDKLTVEDFEMLVIAEK
jgi:2-polyprenyl-3-methyl-5-hydroxy-6-metoxy-1,4-benzoquinol methylase